MLCVLKYVQTNPVAIYHHPIVTNNMADVGNGGKIPKGKGRVYPLAGDTIMENNIDINIKNQMMDPEKTISDHDSDHGQQRSICRCLFL